MKFGRLLPAVLQLLAIAGDKALTPMSITNQPWG